MAPPKRKARGRLRKERIIGPHYSHRQHRKRPDIPRRAQTHQPIRVREMVYRLLNADKHNQERRERRERRVSSGGGFHGKMRKYQNAREPSYDSSPLRDSSASIEESEYTKSAATSVENLSRVMDAANSSRASSSGNSSVSNISVEPIVLAKSIDNTRVLLKKKSLVQVINNYIKAGIEEGKRRAKKYIRKALSFGVKSGYLIPTDPQGQVIRVSPTLIDSKRSDVESRKRRRMARKGEEEPFTSSMEHRRPTPPWNMKKSTRREDTPKPESPPRKRRKSSDFKNVDTKKKLKKKPAERAKRGRRKNAGRKKSKLMLSTLSNVSSNKSEENLKRPKRTRSSHKQEVTERIQDSRRRRTRSPRPRKEEEENSRKNRRDSSDEDEDSVKFSDNGENERASIGRRKSTTSREDPPRNSNATAGNSGREDEEKLESPNETINENNTVGNEN